MSRLFWQREEPRIGETFVTPAGRWKVLETRGAKGGGFEVVAERRS